MTCLFCGIASGEVPAEIVMQSADVVAFADIKPIAPQHYLVVTKRHFATLGELTASQEDGLAAKLFAAATALGRDRMPDGYRIVVNTGADGGQTVPHVHVHVIGGRAMNWPPG